MLMPILSLSSNRYLERVDGSFETGWSKSLIVLSSVKFFLSRESGFIGNKALLERQILEMTGIPVKEIQGSP